MNKPKLPGKIEQLAKKDNFAGWMLASRGKVFSPLEEQVWMYLQGLKMWERETAENKRLHEPYLAQNAQSILDFVLDAIAELNPKKITELATAVSYFKAHDGIEPDPVRACLLCYKQVFENGGRKFVSPEHAANVCNYQGNMDVFKKMLRALKIPVVKRRGGRPKNPRQIRRRSR